MKSVRTNSVPILAGIFLGICATFLSGCAASKAGDAQAGTSPKSAQAGAAAGKGAAQLWAENCLHCHNSRSPSAYSDGEWEAAMLHMRIRANLTAEEHRKIVEFLKASN